jgi:hypothetical protein
MLRENGNNCKSGVLSPMKNLRSQVFPAKKRDIKSLFQQLCQYIKFHLKAVSTTPMNQIIIDATLKFN